MSTTGNANNQDVTQTLPQFAMNPSTGPTKRKADTPETSSDIAPERNSAKSTGANLLEIMQEPSADCSVSGGRAKTLQGFGKVVAEHPSSLDIPKRESIGRG